jgi:poly(ADP-ribose) glycohydrolase ARH3
MAITDPILKERFEGCLFGLAVGDALGAKFEAQSAEGIRTRFPSADQLIAYPQEEIWYTDDTQMAIGICEALIEKSEIVEDVLCRAFVANYVPSRGYGRGARAILEAMEDDGDYRQVAERHFPGGSFGNGAAMRVAPVGLLFRDDLDVLREQARLSALPTHLHPLGIEGAQLLALAVALCSRMERFDRYHFFASLLGACKSEEYRTKIKEASRVTNAESLAGLGNRIEALHSVPTAIASVALTPESFEATICNVIFLGGDTDTMAAMAGSLSGAYLGTSRLPAKLINLLESSPKGRMYIKQLAEKLFTIYHSGQKSALVKAPDPF